MKGRETNGIVDPAQGDALMREIRDKLLGVHDPKDNSQVITRIDLASEVYQGPYARSGPDALVGYNRGYRAGWTTILGAFPADVLEDNTNPWSGDHCMDYTKVPGVLLSNRKIAADAPALTDIAPTILAEYGIAKKEEMKGQSVF
jgi:predicted AlkP superfamily phosphohydrolase/phosphomutase